MTRDPWAVDWEDDWTKAAKETKSSSEIWSRANATPDSTPSIAPTIAYRPQIQILKRETQRDVAPQVQKEIKTLDAEAREARYKEARERLFGTPEPAVASPARRQSPAAREGISHQASVKPERQARGPSESDTRGGFSGRGRGSSQRQR